MSDPAGMLPALLRVLGSDAPTPAAAPPVAAIAGPLQLGRAVEMPAMGEVVKGAPFPSQKSCRYLGAAPLRPSPHQAPQIPTNW